MAVKPPQKSVEIKNKRASFDYEISETWVAGIVLTGTEIKSLRLSKASLVDCYCYIHQGEMFVRGMNIAEYHWGSYNNHAPKRERKLLLQKKELRKIERQLQDKGATVVGLKIFINDKGLAKLVIGLGRGRKNYDKRENIKEKDTKRELDRAMKR
ncbi:MAG: SsrA-binding protein SmpB [Rikenellaceae bacterium]